MEARATGARAAPGTGVQAGPAIAPAGRQAPSGKPLLLPTSRCSPDHVLRCAGSDDGVRWREGERLDHLFEDRCDDLRRQGRDRHLAVDGPDASFTYGDLDAAANRLARYLLAGGARAGDRIGLLFDQPVRSYVAMLAALKINAAYVPLDAGFPTDRLAYIVEDAGVRTVLSLSHLRQRLAGVAAHLLCLDEADPRIAAQDGGRLGPAERSEPADDLCYIIYTSGSTGRPKGVAIEHPTICNFVRVAADLYGIRSDDRVYQGMTIAFDFAVEEIWVPWMAGATLVPKPGGTSLLGYELWEHLDANRVTALCCVPTLLATIDRDLPRLRFLLVSGEACPQDLIRRWYRPDRRFLNVYGPTEATVTATWAAVHPDEPVTIGVPLPTYAVVILDTLAERALPPGELGEIGIAGPVLASGYLNREDLTGRAFMPDFLGIPGNVSGRIYRTGDLGRVNRHGQIEYHGRIDTQVKIRGYRIELTEIESVLLQVPGIAQVVVNTHEPEPGRVALVAYYSLHPDAGEVDRSRIAAHLRANLPGYMIPTYLEHLPVIPMLPSDKADRKALPPPAGPYSPGSDDDHVEPATDTEQALAAALRGVLGVQRVSAGSHFFDDLGANSLLMAQFCAHLRERTHLPAPSMKDVYLHPTIRALAATMANPDAAAEPGRPAPEDGPPPAVASSRRYMLCGAAQLLLFLISVALGTFVFATGLEWMTAHTGWVDMYLRALVFGVVTFLLWTAAPIVAKWVLVGRWQPTRIPIWSATYVRFWFVKTLIRVNPMVAFVGSPLYVLYLRALGARIGRNVVILSRTVPVCTDLLTIGDGTVIRKDAFFTCYRAEAGIIQTGRVTLGNEVFVGEKTVLDIDTSMGDETQLGHASALHTSQAVPAGEHWHGSPAQPTGADYQAATPAHCGTFRRVAYSALQLLTMLAVTGPLAFGVFVTLLLEFPLLRELLHPDQVLLGTWELYRDALVLSLILFFGGFVFGLVFVTTVPRLLNHALEPRRIYPLYGFHFWIQRTVARMTNVKFFMDLFGDSSAVVYYLRALGYDLGRIEQTGSNFGTELQQESPYLSVVGTGTMVSDALSIMNADFSSTSFRVAPVSLGARSFYGNNVAYPTGGRTGDNCLLATKVLVPVDGQVRSDVGLLGSPCFEIPRTVRRDRSFDELAGPAERPRRLAAKNRYNAATMAVFLLVRWFLFFVTTVFMLLAVDLYQSFGALSLTAATLCTLAFAIAYSILVERATLRFRRLRPRLCSIYEPYFWWHERLWKLGAFPLFNGTPFKNVIWRLLGVRIGRRVYDAGCAIPEKTLVAVGDDCTLNEGSVIQCHSLEDGIFKSDFTTLGARCTLGIESFVHYGVTLRDEAVLEADAFLMKGEDVPAGARWRGNPATTARTLPAPAPRVPSDTNAPAATSGATSLLEGMGPVALPREASFPGVAVWVLALDEVRRRERECWDVLTAEERDEAGRLGSVGRRAEFVASRAVVRLALSGHRSEGPDPRDWRLQRTARGKLRVLAPEGTGMDLSVSHTTTAIAVAVSASCDVGVDLEPAAPGEPAVTRAVLTPEEQARLATRDGESEAAFTRMWTLKEAFAKCSGDGLALRFDRLETSFDPPSVTSCGPGTTPQSEAVRVAQAEVTVAGEPHWLALVARPR